MWSTLPCCERAWSWTWLTRSGSSPTPLFQGGGPFCSPDSCAKLTENGFVEPPQHSRYAAHQRACAVARETSVPPRSITIFAFGIFPKIREVDDSPNRPGIGGGRFHNAAAGRVEYSGPAELDFKVN